MDQVRLGNTGISINRLGTDYIDLFLFHLGTCQKALAFEVRDTLEMLVREGKIRSYGWSTEDPDRAHGPGDLYARGIGADLREPL